MKDTSPDKRTKVIDDLLTRKEFVEIWLMKWAELLQIRTNQNISTKSMLSYYTWLQNKIASNVPMDVMVQELLGSQGGTFANPGDQLLPERDRHAEDGRKRRPGLHGYADPMLAVP